MKKRIMRKWFKLMHSYEKNSYMTKDGLMCLVGEATPNQEKLLYHKHRKELLNYVAMKIREITAEDEQDRRNLEQD